AGAQALLARDDTGAVAALERAISLGADAPEIHEWLGAALMRRKSFDRARAVLDQAAARWPDDSRFSRPLALLNAIFGRGRDAMTRLEQHLGADENDVGSLFLAVQWMFSAVRTGVHLHDATEDLRLARSYADRYARLGGPRQPLVTQWVAYLGASVR